MTETSPKATHTGTLAIGNMEIPCAVLENGKRVLTQEGFLHAIGRARKAKGGQGATVDKMPAFLAAKNLKPFISNELVESTRPVRFRHVKGQQAFGYPAELLPKVCDVYLHARDAGALDFRQAPIAAKCDILVRGLATVGIIALVDEATGYQNVRARKALEEILDKFISEELRKWAKTFPDEFYKEIFRLKNWPFAPWSVKRPGVIGRYTNDIVYERLAPGVLDELRRKNPVTPKGHRKVRHHQWLTEDIGHPRLREHIAAVIALMRASNNWTQFNRMLQRAFPRIGTNLELPFSDEEQPRTD